MTDFINAGQRRFKEQTVIEVLSKCRGCGSDSVYRSATWAVFKMFGEFCCINCGHLTEDYNPVLKDAPEES